jgi:hypothetical protein
MIVRCTNCNSAFAVDDAKVENKKFAFTCPKCDNENVIDNRLQIKSSLAGPAIVDEALRDTSEDLAPERGHREEALVGRGMDDAFDELPVGRGHERTGGRDLMSEEDILLDESPAIDTDDLSGLAEPEQETETSLEAAELPPADDMQSDMPLDDLLLDDELKDLDIEAPGKEEKGAAAGSGRKTSTDDTDSLIFEEQNEDLDEMKKESDLIHDELDVLEDAGEPVELAEVDDIDKLLAEDEKQKEIIDEFEPIDLDMARPGKTAVEPDLLLDDEIKTEEMYRADGADDESITIDLDTLDIDLEGGEGKPNADVKANAKAAPEAAVAPLAPAASEDENITIDLDTLDIDLQEGEEVSTGEAQEDLGLDLSDFSDETIQELEGASKPSRHAEEEDITLNLEELDISLEESDEIKDGEILDEDEKLTLEDAGLTLEELTTDELSSVSARADRKDEEDIKLTIEEVDPDFDMQAIEKELKEAESILSEAPGVENDRSVIDELSDLPDIDFDEDLELVDIETGKKATPVLLRDDDLIKIDEEEKPLPKRGGLKKELPDMVPRGAVNISIDYSLKYSRIGALLRLCGLFLIGLIPHYAVFFVYNMLSLILSGLNHLVVIATGKNVEDFSGIHENTLRYLLSISSSMIGIVEEMPVYAGRNNIDYPLQLRVVYPLRSSKLLAVLRLTGIGILLFSLPHLLILGLISLFIPLLFLVGMISVLATGGWPHLLFEFMTRYYRYSARVLAFNIGLVDVYPSFKFE